MICEGYTPYPWQKEVHDAITKHGGNIGYRFVVKSPRQVGKSLLIENELLRYAINFPGTVSMAVSPTLAQVRKLYKDILEAVGTTSVIRRKNDTLLEIDFKNGSHVMFKSAEQKDSLRGYTISGILAIDEAAYIADDIFALLIPTCNVHNASMLICSTPRYSTGFFFKNYSRFLDSPLYQGANGISFDFCRYDLSRFLSKEKLSMYRETMPDNQFRTEILGEFLDSDACVFKGIDKVIHKKVYDASGKLIVGIDWGSGQGQDFTVMSCFDTGNKQQRYLKYFNNKSTNEQIDFIAKWLIEHKEKIQLVIAEANSIGLPMINQLKAKLAKYHIKVVPFDTTNKSKNDLVTMMQVQIENKFIRLQDDPQQTLQFRSYAYTYNPKTQKISYNAPDGLHDDIVMATMIALKGFDYALTGKYTLG